MTANADSPSFTVQPQTPQRQIRHRSSLEHVLTFTLTSPLPQPHEVSEAILLYHLILDDCEAANMVLQKPQGDGDTIRHDIDTDTDELDDLDEIDCSANKDDHGDDDNEDDDAQLDGTSVPLHKLFRAIYDHSPTPEGQVNIVRIALHGMFPAENHDDAGERSLRRILPRARQWRSFTPGQRSNVYRILTIFAGEFLEGFFVPLKAQGRCTPAVSQLITPTSRTEVGPEQGTPTRLHDLRKLCLARDGNRCVVTQKHDRKYIDKLRKRTGRRIQHIGIKTEAAHIIPHSLNALTTATTDLHPSKRTVWRTLNMFDPGISSILTGTLIDTPMNAMILAAELHDRFGSLQCYLQADPTAGDNAYTFHTTRGASTLDPAFAPAASHIVFKNNERGDTVPADLPSPRLLALHRACCLMLSISGAAEYVENLLDDTEALMQKGVLAEDGSSNVALFLRMRGIQDEVLDRDLPELVLAQ